MSMRGDIVLNNLREKSIILLSGGLDSLVSLGLKKEELNIDLALMFDYGQKALEKEIKASQNICKYYNIEYKLIELGWLKDITQTSLVSDDNIPTNEALNDTYSCAKSVWVPNRNGLFLNIAASYADSMNYDYIIIGANNEEAQTFPDNSQQFISAVNEELQYSTLKRPRVVAPLINYNKNDIVKVALEHGIPLELAMSCYQSTKGHCGMCESCQRLKHALIYNKADSYLRSLFG